MVKISVIIPIYNVEKYIEECIKSVCEQTLKEIEIICVNDGTKDDSMKIVSKYAKKDKRIKIINKDNGGLSSARNKGLDTATGKYVYFIDSDDYITKECLEILYDTLEKNNLDILFFDALSFYEDKELSEEQTDCENYYIRGAMYNKVSTGQELFLNMRKNLDYRASACLQILRKEFVDKYNLRFEEGIIHEDELFSLLGTLYSDRVMHISEPFYMRRVRPGSIMTESNSIKSSYGYFKTIIKVIPHISKNVEDPEVFNMYYSYIKTLFNSSINNITSISSNELEAFEIELPKEELILYKLLIENNYLNKETITKLKQTNKENRSLKRLFVRKSANLIRRIIRKVLGTLRKLLSKIKYIFINRPKVSIIIPVYNCKDFLKETVDSLIAQTLKKIEIIFVDDESTDGSFELLKDYEKNDSRIKVIKQEHSNAGNARNVGIKNAKGEYFLFLDSDDIFDKNLCKKSFECAVKNKAEVVLFGARKKDSLTGKYRSIPHILNKKLIPKNRVFSAKEVSDNIFQLTSSAPWSKLFKASYIRKNNFKFQSCTNSNDVFFTRTVLASSKRIVMLNKILVDYRINHGINTQAKKHKEPLAFMNAYIEVKKYLCEKNMYELYRNSFRNILLNEIVFNYTSTTTEEAKQKILDALTSGGLEKLDMHNFSKEDAYSFNLYNKFVNIINKNIQKKDCEEDK